VKSLSGVEVPEATEIGNVNIPATKVVDGVEIPSTRELYAGKNWIPKNIKKGGLGGWSKDLSATKRHQILTRIKNQSSYKTVISRLNFLNNISDDPETDRVAKSDMKFMQKKYRYGAYATKTYVPYLAILFLFGIAYFVKRKG